jgi:hypothetical protein
MALLLLLLEPNIHILINLFNKNPSKRKNVNTYIHGKTAAKFDLVINDKFYRQY